MAEVTWLGDADPTVQSIEQYGHTFVKGVPTSVPDKDPKMAKFKAMSVFHVKGDDKGAPEPVPSDEPEAPDVEAGTEIGTLKAQLRQLGHAPKGNPGVETLRKQLAEHTAQ